jgi:hypothetical protein
MAALAGDLPDDSTSMSRQRSVAAKARNRFCYGNGSRIAWGHLGGSCFAVVNAEIAIGMNGRNIETDRQTDWQADKDFLWQVDTMALGCTWGGSWVWSSSENQDCSFTQSRHYIHSSHQ